MKKAKFLLFAGFMGMFIYFLFGCNNGGNEEGPPDDNRPMVGTVDTAKIIYPLTGAFIISRIVRLEDSVKYNHILLLDSTGIR
jgi:hypothetical protein